MDVILFFILSMTIAYQADKPCDDACFRKKMQQERVKQIKKRERR